MHVFELQLVKQPQLPTTADIVSFRPGKQSQSNFGGRRVELCGNTEARMLKLEDMTSWFQIWSKISYAQSNKTLQKAPCLN